MDSIYIVQLDCGAKYAARSQDNLKLKVDDWCVIRKDFYQDYGKVIREKGELTCEAAKKTSLKFCGKPLFMIKVSHMKMKCVPNPRIARHRSMLKP